MKNKRFCGNCGESVYVGDRFCIRCGKPLTEQEYLDQSCGASMQNKVQNPQSNESEQKNKTYDNCETVQTKYGKGIAITNIIIGAVLLLLNMNSDYEWTLAPTVLGVGICVTGILLLLKKNPQIIAVIQIIMGALCILMSLEMTYDWEYVGFVAGAGMLTLGILTFLRKSLKMISIVEIVFGGVSILLGLICIDWAWGDTGILAGSAFLVEGILNIKHSNTTETNV